MKGALDGYQPIENYCLILKNLSASFVLVLNRSPLAFCFYLCAFRKLQLETAKAWFSVVNTVKENIAFLVDKTLWFPHGSLGRMQRKSYSHQSLADTMNNHTQWHQNMQSGHTVLMNLTQTEWLSLETYLKVSTEVVGHFPKDF